MERKKSNKMATMPVGRLVINVSLPLMVSLLVQSLYNIVDGIYVAQLSENALAATSLAYPIQMLMVAVSVGTGVGINSLISRKIGEKRYDEVSAGATNGLFLAAASMLVFLVFGLALVPGFFRLYTAETELIEMGVPYLRICTIFSGGIFIAATSERMLQATGNTKLSMIAQVSGCVVNIALDPLLIFGGLGLPALGTAGAAIATVVGQWAAAAIALALNARYNPDVRFRFRGFRPDARVIGCIYRVGVPSMMVQAVGSAMVMGMNRILVGFSATAVAFFGVYYKLQNFLFMPVSGLSQGLIPIVGFNYGARRPERIVRAIRTAAVIGAAIMLLGTGVFQLFPAQLLGLYRAGEEMLALGTRALRIISPVFVPTSFVLVVGYAFTGMGNGVINMVNTILRELLALPIVYLLARGLGVDYVWYAFWISNLAALTFALLALRHAVRSKLHPMQRAGADGQGA